MPLLTRQPLRTHPGRVCRGLTLVELLVVLLILAILATAAVRATDGLAGQARYESTGRSLGHLEDALLGSPDDRDANGSRRVAGFVADIGRLPLAVGGDPETQLIELWSNDRDSNGVPDLPAWSVQSPAGDPDVDLAAGWRGPYLRLPAGGTRLFDGWGAPFVLMEADETAVADGEAVAIVRSLGSDRAADGTDYAADASLVIEQATAPVVPARHTTTVYGNVYYPDTPDDPDGTNGRYVVVRLYGPTAGDVGTLAEATHDLVTTPGPVSFSFTGVSIGPRVLRAYQTATLPADPDTPVTVTPGVNTSSQPIAITAIGQRQDLVLIDR